MTFEYVKPFRELFQGLDFAYGTGKGEWIKRPPRPEDWLAHLDGRGPGLGIAPLRQDNTVMFSAIDLDEPDFEAAVEMQRYIPGESWVERTRSGNVHVWVFFSRPAPAWLAMGVLKEATLAAGKKGVEVFPKNPDFARVKLGNYINLPYFGQSRPILWNPSDPESGLTMPEFIERAHGARNDPDSWLRKAALMQIGPPSARENRAEFGTQGTLHVCADRIISGEAGPILEGTRNQVFFMLSKCLTNWSQVDDAETLDILLNVNADLCSPPEDEQEIRRILRNCIQNEYTSTGCDDPLVESYTDPNCRIAHPRRR